MPEFTYHHLAAGHIRLVSLSLAPGDKLSASVKHVFLDNDEPIAYSALSYAWGTTDATVPVECNGEVLYVTPSLDEALRQVVMSDANGWLWVDQICINQRDDQERSEQVDMMNRIFSRKSSGPVE